MSARRQTSAQRGRRRIGRMRELAGDEVGDRALGTGAPFAPREQVVPLADRGEVDRGGYHLFADAGLGERDREARELDRGDHAAAGPLGWTVAGADSVGRRGGDEVLVRPGVGDLLE